MNGMTPALVVLGATGGIGRGVVAAAVAAGRPVIAVARGEAALRRLQARHPQADLTVLAASVASDGEAAALAARLHELGRRIGGVVVAVCGALARGRLLDQPAAFLRRVFDEDLLPHLFAARHLLPMLAEEDRSGGYVLIGGPGADQPWASYGHRSIAAAALRMLARVLHDEARTSGVRVQLLAVDSPVCTENNRDHACPQWPSASSVGRRALALIDRAGAERATAVVRYAAPAMPSTFWSDDLDGESEAPAPAQAMTPQVIDRERARPRESTPSPANANTTNAQEADGDKAATAQRSLHDARTLLRALATSPSPQETPSP